MEEVFKKLQKDNQNSVDNLIKWMKDSKLVDEKKVTEDKARKLFSDVKDTSNVEFTKFQEVVGKLANEHSKTVDHFAKTLADEAPKFLNAAMTAAKAAASAAASAAANTFKDAFSNK